LKKKYEEEAEQAREALEAEANKAAKEKEDAALFSIAF